MKNIITSANGNGNAGFITKSEVVLSPVTKSSPLPGVGNEGVTHPKHKELFEEGRSFAVAGKIRNRTYSGINCQGAKCG
jgi:hypothetical protein